MREGVVAVRNPEKLAQLIAEYAVSGNLSAASKKCGVKYATAMKWRQRGFLDPDSEQNASALARRITPERMLSIASTAYQLVDRAQERVLETIDEASARDASKIAQEQFMVGQLASGQATNRVEHYTRQDLVNDLQELGLQEEVIEAEVVDQAA